MVVCGGFRDVNLAALKTPCGPAAPIFVPQQRDTVSSGRECARTRVFFNRGDSPPLLLSPPPPPPPSQPQPQPQPSSPSSWCWLLLLANAGAAGERPSAGKYIIPRE
ncbi:hypothetical protein P5V15_012098 [Pogonomyrmex californicus]